MEPEFRHLQGFPIVIALAVGLAHEHGKAEAQRLDRGARLRRVALDVDAQHLQPPLLVFSVDSFRAGKAMHSGLAPARPKIQQHYLPAKVGQAHLRGIAAENGQRKVRSAFLR